MRKVAWLAIWAAAACGGSSHVANENSVGPQDAVLTIAVTGSGTVRGSGLECRGACTQRMTKGTRVLLQATPDGGMSFGGWGGACSGMDTCDLTLDGDKTITAAFAAPPPPPPRRQLTVLVTGHGSVRSAPSGIDCGATCSAAFDDGAQVTLNANPDAGFAFTGWTGSCSGAGACTLALNGDAQVAARFDALPPPPPTMALLSLTVTGSGSVRSTPSGIDCTPLCSASFAAGTSVALVAQAAAGYRFMGWSGACSGTDTLCRTTLNANASVGARFELVNVVLLDTQTWSSALALNTSDVFFPVWNGQSYEVRAIPKAGGMVRSLVATPGFPSFIVADDANVFFVSFEATGAGMYRVPAAGGSPTRLGDASFSSAAAIDDSNVYWVSGRCCGSSPASVFTAPKGGGTVTTLASGQFVTGPIAVDATDVWFSTTDSIRRVSKKGGPVDLPIACGQNSCGFASLKLDAANLYFRDSRGVAYAKAKASNAFYNVSSGHGEGFAADLDVNASIVYWLGNNSIWSASFDGSNVTSLESSNSVSFHSLRVDDAHLFYFQNTQLIRRLK